MWFSAVSRCLAAACVFFLVGSARLCMCGGGIIVAAQGVRSVSVNPCRASQNWTVSVRSSHFGMTGVVLHTHSLPTTRRVSERVTDANHSMHTQLKSHSHNRRCNPRAQARDAARHTQAAVPAVNLLLALCQRFSSHEQRVQAAPAVNHARPQQDAFSMHPLPGRLSGCRTEPPLTCPSQPCRAGGNNTPPATATAEALPDRKSVV